MPSPQHHRVPAPFSRPACGARAPRLANRHKGFFLADALVGLLLLGTLAALLAVTASRMNRADHRLADARAATRLAERTLLILQANTTLPPVPDNATLSVHRLEGESGDRVWVRVDAAVNGRPATLYGLLPSQTADTATQTYGGPRP